MGDPVDMIQLVRDLPARARGRACIVLTHEYAGQSEWAAKLARQTGSGHLDLLEHFAQDESLGSKIGDFSVAKLFDFLSEHSQSQVLIVSGLEFLKATWAAQPNATEQFASRVETWNRTPCLLFVLQYDRTLATRDFRRFRQYTFVVDQEETLAL